MFLQYASFNLGNEVNCVSRPRDADAPVALQTMQDIYELRLNKVKVQPEQLQRV